MSEKKKLVIVESPTKAKTLSGILDKSYVIEASFGHIRDLPKKGLSINVKKNFEPDYEVPDKAKKVLSQLKKQLKTSERVVLATDPDREGEAIAWHIKELLTPAKSAKSKKDTLSFERVVFHELTKSAVLESFEHPGHINENLVDAQQARRVLDRLVGYELSPLLWKKVGYGLSAGRVQSVAVRLVVERERERDAFKSKEYWSVHVELEPSGDAKRIFVATLDKYKGKNIEIGSEKEAKEIENILKKDALAIKTITKSERTKNPYPPLKTSTMQQSMSNVFGFNATKTMSAAQKLFEKGLITYHRTDSLSLSDKFIKDARKYVESELGKSFVPDTPNYYKSKSKNAQEAHEAIRPTKPELHPDKLPKMTNDEKKVYSLIWKRALESQMGAAIYDTTSVLVESSSEYMLKATGSVIKFKGWLALGDKMGLSADSHGLNVLPNLSEGESVTAQKIDSVQHFTQPPARYSDASLVKALEELGIGRPSTYAPTIGTILKRGYIVREGRYFVPKDVAYVVTDLLVEHFPDVSDYNFTALLEEDLDLISNGDKEWVPVIREFYGPFEKKLKLKDKELSKQEVTTLEETDEVCPECGSKLVVKLGKYGKFLSCSNFPKCEYARPLEQGSQEDFGKCTECEDGVFILKQGRFGKFLACSNYPKCKTTKPYLEKIGMVCPKCGKGDVIVKKAKGRIFYGCSEYPECDYSSWKNPLGATKAKKIEDENLEMMKDAKAEAINFDDQDPYNKEPLYDAEDASSVSTISDDISE